MSSYKLPLSLRLKVSGKGLLQVLKRPGYAVILYIIFWITLGLLVWLTNWRLLIDYFTNNTHSTSDKLNFFTSGYTSLITNFSLASAGILVIFAVLTGMNTALLAFVISKSFKEAVASGTKNMVSIVAAAVGAGCAACGTSFLAPVLAGVSGAFSLTLTMVIGIAANVLGLVLLTYSIYKLGSSAASLVAKDF